MAPTPDTLTRHELVGLPVRVVESTDPNRVGTAGVVVRETTNTLVVERGPYPAPRDGERRVGASGGREVQVPKGGTVFEFALPGERTEPTDEAAGERRGSARAPDRAPDDRSDREDPGTASEPAAEAGDDVAYVTVEGDLLRARPARRTEQGVDSIWR